MGTTKSSIKKIFYTWQDLEKDCRILASRIKKDKIKYERIVAVTRGGLFVAGMLSRFLDLVPVDTVSIHCYYGSSRRRMVVLKKGFSSELSLICDDIVDNGDTMDKVKEMYPNSKVITLHYKSKKNPIIIPDYFIEDVDAWIHYPWEVEERK